MYTISWFRRLSLKWIFNLLLKYFFSFTFLDFGVVSMLENRGLIEKSIFPKSYFSKRHLIGPLVPRRHGRFPFAERLISKQPFAPNGNRLEREVKPTDRK